MKAYFMQQTSAEWWQIRRGVPTASEFNRIIRASDGTLSKGRKKFLAELLEEAAMPDAAYFSSRGVWRGTQAMQDGKDVEGEARAWYAMHADCDVQMVGFCMSAAGTYGCSPDGVLGLMRRPEGDTCKKGLELKCPLLKTQFERLLDPGRLPPEYKVQVHGCMAVTGANCWDFVSYHPDAGGVIIPVERDAYTEQVKSAVEEFVAELIHEAQRLGVILGSRQTEPAEADAVRF